MKITNIQKITNCKYLNLFTATYKDKKDKQHLWVFSSRKENTRIDDGPDAVMIVPFMDDKIVLLKQFRVPVKGYIYEFPAGIKETDESILDCAVRELKEETGLDVELLKVYNSPLYNSCGISDETVSIVFAKVKGEISLQDTEDTEDIEVLVLNKDEISSMLNNQDIIFSAKCWLILQAFSQGFKWI